MHVVGEWLSDGKYDYIKAKFGSEWKHIIHVVMYIAIGMNNGKNFHRKHIYIYLRLSYLVCFWTELNIFYFYSVRIKDHQQILGIRLAVKAPFRKIWLLRFFKLSFNLANMLLEIFSLKFARHAEITRCMELTERYAPKSSIHSNKV